MRIALVVAASVAALAAALAAPATAAPIPAVSAADDIADTELAKFAEAMEAVQAISAEVEGGTPTAEQQAAMAAAIEQAGLDIARFNAISTAVSSDAVVRARLAVAASPESSAGSAAAGVTDAELDQFAAAMAGVRPIASALNGAAPSAEQQAAMAEAIAASGLGIERFNAISAATSSDARLRARLALADAKRAG